MVLKLLMSSLAKKKKKKMMKGKKKKKLRKKGRERQKYKKKKPSRVKKRITQVVTQVITFTPSFKNDSDYSWCCRLDFVDIGSWLRCLDACGLIIIINVGVLQEVHKERALSEPTVPVSLDRQNVKFKTSFRNCVFKALNQREWKETDGDDWNLMWCEK